MTNGSVRSSGFWFQFGLFCLAGASAGQPAAAPTSTPTNASTSERSTAPVRGGEPDAMPERGGGPTSRPEPARPPAPGGAVRLDDVVVEGRGDSLIGIAESAGQGTVGAEELARRPLLRPGEVLETVPGVIVSQHSGAGKANQFFLRGFNLDHGTDFATDVNGMPVNLPSHAHGQGWTDLNFVIPELVGTVDFRKGPYFVEEGDFASAGAADIEYFTVLPKGLFVVEAGSFGFARTVLADSPQFAGGNLLYGIELYRADGPWENPDDYEKINGVLRYSRGDRTGGFSLTAMAYKGEWDATDQIPQRAVDRGLIGRFGSLDETDGGMSQRYSLSGEAHRADANSKTQFLAYSYYYDLDLYSNFTYALVDPVNGDQFAQSDRRIVSGLKASHTIFTQLLGRESEYTFGAQVRHDFIDDVGLFATNNRDVLRTIRRDEVNETNIGVFLRNQTQWSEKFRTFGGVRVDYFAFDVGSSNIPANAGTENDFIVSPKGGLAIGPFAKTEFYLNGGLGYHSNDARGVTTTVDPDSREFVEPADPLVQSRGAEVGLRTLIVPGLQSTLALWVLELDSELLFVGDAGTTDAGRPSRRYGVEWANYYQLTPEWTFDFDLSLSEARFTDDDPAGDVIPGSIESAIGTGIAYRQRGERGYFGSLRARFVGPRPLIEDDSVRADASTLISAQVGYRFNDNLSLAVEFFNVLDAEENDIEYYYPSRLPGEPVGPDEGGFNDIHLHPAERFAVRVGLTARF